MCAIVGSFDRDRLIELIKLNNYRGTHSFSFSTYDIKSRNLEVHVRGLGPFDYNVINIGPSQYGIAHIQAPTSDDKSISEVHPASASEVINNISTNTFLWHNGIIKAGYVRKLQKHYGEDTSWDTKLVLRAINRNTNEIHDLDGSFSCLWYNGIAMYFFRNDISPMFMDNELNISSTKFLNSKPIPSGIIHYVDFDKRVLYDTEFKFKTVDNPYYFSEVT